MYWSLQRQCDPLWYWWSLSWSNPGLISRVLQYLPERRVLPAICQAVCCGHLRQELWQWRLQWQELSVEAEWRDKLGRVCIKKPGSLTYIGGDKTGLGRIFSGCDSVEGEWRCKDRGCVCARLCALFHLANCMFTRRTEVNVRYLPSWFSPYFSYKISHLTWSS